MHPSPTRRRYATVAALCAMFVAACNSSPTAVDTEGGKSNKLLVSPVQVDFGSSGSSASVTLSNPTNRAFSWSASESAGWLSLGASSGTIWANSTRTISLSADRGSMAAGTYKTNLKVVGERGAVAVDALAEVRPG